MAVELMVAQMGWTSHEDAEAAGFGGDVVTPEAFESDPDLKAKYGDYQSYLDAMYKEKTGNDPVIPSQSAEPWTSHDDAAAAGYGSEVLSEEDFNNNEDLKKTYGTYAIYLAAMQALLAGSDSGPDDGVTSGAGDDTLTDGGEVPSETITGSGGDQYGKYDYTINGDTEHREYESGYSADIVTDENNQTWTKVTDPDGKHYYYGPDGQRISEDEYNLRKLNNEGDGGQDGDAGAGDPDTPTTPDVVDTPTTPDVVDTPTTPVDESEEDHPWGSYKDAAGDGFSNIMTESEFARHNHGQYESYQDYLDAMYEKYVVGGAAGVVGAGAGDTGGADADAGSSASNRTQFSSGDAVTISGDQYHVYGFVPTGSGQSLAIYEGSDGKLYYIGADGQMNKVIVNQVTNVSNMYGGMPSTINTTADATANWDKVTSGVGTISYGTSLTINGAQYKVGEILSSGFADNNVTVNSNGTQTSYGNVTEGVVADMNFSSMASSNNGTNVVLANHDGESSVLTVPGNQNSFTTAVNNHQPIKLQEGHYIDYDNYLSPSYKIGGDADTYLVYHKGNYYVADEYGNILDYNKPLSVDGLTGSGWWNDSSFV